jgi:hypothetical protein
MVKGKRQHYGKKKDNTMVKGKDNNMVKIKRPD